MAVDLYGVREHLGPREIHVLRVSAGAVAVLVAWLHLLHPEYGYSSLLLYVEFGTVYDPRPPLFVLSALAIFVGIFLVFYDVSRRPIYLLGIGLMATYLLGFVGWHTILEHGAFWPHIEAHSHAEMGVLETIVSHLQADTIAMVSKAAELFLLSLLAVLYLIDTDTNE